MSGKYCPQLANGHKTTSGYYPDDMNCRYLTSVAARQSPQQYLREEHPDIYPKRKLNSFLPRVIFRNLFRNKKVFSDGKLALIGGSPLSAPKNPLTLGFVGLCVTVRASKAPCAVTQQKQARCTGLQTGDFQSVSLFSVMSVGFPLGFF